MIGFGGGVIWWDFALGLEKELGWVSGFLRFCFFDFFWALPASWADFNGNGILSSKLEVIKTWMKRMRLNLSWACVKECIYGNRYLMGRARGERCGKF